MKKQFKAKICKTCKGKGSIGAQAKRCSDCNGKGYIKCVIEDETKSDG